MTERRTFYRKLVYFGCIAVLLLPLSWLCQPATSQSVGGVLAKMRTKYKLSQSSLGEIDPTSETMRLGSLGMRGVATVILWNRADHFKMVKDWANVTSTVEQIVRLQPNFIGVWDFQAHNLAYNISVEFDDYHDRYWWVIRGLNFLIEGTKYNLNEPKLVSRIGWHIGQKIGRSDEKQQFRRMFFRDQEFNAPWPKNSLAVDSREQPIEGWDNWLIAYHFQDKAREMVDRGFTLRGMPESIFHSEPAMALTHYAIALEDEGLFTLKIRNPDGDYRVLAMAKDAWTKASAEWTKYAAREMNTSYNLRVRLADKEYYKQQAREISTKIDALAPAAARDDVRRKHREALPADQRAALDVAPDKRTSDQRMLCDVAERKLREADKEVAELIVDPDQRRQALKLVKESGKDEGMAMAIDTYRGFVNFDYWVARCQAESLDEMIDARQSIYQAGHAFDRAELAQAKKLYEQGWRQWRAVLDKFPTLREDPPDAQNLAHHIDRYRKLLNQLDLPFPDDFALKDVMELANKTDPDRQAQAAQPPAKPGEKPVGPGEKPKP